MQAVLFLSRLSAIAEEIHVIVNFAFLYLGYKEKFIPFITRTDSHKIIYPVCDSREIKKLS